MPGRPLAGVVLASTDGAVVAPESRVERLVQAFAEGRYVVVERAFNESWEYGKDDFALEVLEATSDETLQR